MFEMIFSGEAPRLLALHVDLNPASMNGAFLDTGLGASLSLSRQTTACDAFGFGQGTSSANTVAFGAAVTQTGDDSRLAPFFTDVQQTGAGQVGSYSSVFHLNPLILWTKASDSLQCNPVEMG